MSSKSVLCIPLLRPAAGRGTCRGPAVPGGCARLGRKVWKPPHAGVEASSPESALVALSGCSGHAVGTTALPPRADLRAPTSALPAICPASPRAAGLPGAAAVALVSMRSRQFGIHDLLGPAGAVRLKACLEIHCAPGRAYTGPAAAVFGHRDRASPACLPPTCAQRQAALETGGHECSRTSLKWMMPNLITSISLIPIIVHPSFPHAGRKDGARCPSPLQAD